MAMVSGLGGAFVFSPDPAKLAAWYEMYLGLQFESYGEAYYQVFVGLDPDDTSRKLDTTFSILKAKRVFDSFAADPEPEDMYGDQPYMVNLRLNDMAATLAHLREHDIPVIKEEDEGYGLFAWVRDGDGNRVELYQPVPEGGGG